MNKDLFQDISGRIVYEDNHLLAINKHINEPVQGDSSGDPALFDLMKEFIKQRDAKPGNVFLGYPTGSTAPPAV